VNAIRKEASYLLSSETVQIRKQAHIIGTFLATEPAVSTASFTFERENHIPAPAQVLSGQSAVIYRGSGQSVVVERPPPDYLLNSNPEAKCNCCDRVRCIKARVGSSLPGKRIGEKWTAAGTVLHINFLELKAALLALQSFLKNESSVSVLIQMDKQAAIAHINRMGGLILSALSQMVQERWDWYLEHKVSPHAEHLPGKENISLQQQLQNFQVHQKHYQVNIYSIHTVS